MLACSTTDGWANLARIGIHLREKGIHYGKLILFFRDFAHLIETRIDDSVQPPVAYARVRSSSWMNHDHGKSSGDFLSSQQ
ncbi:MAG: hypothetical protein OHK0039_19420 [Bacteroidia bacterium]